MKKFEEEQKVEAEKRDAKQKQKQEKVKKQREAQKTDNPLAHNVPKLSKIDQKK